MMVMFLHRIWYGRGIMDETHTPSAPSFNKDVDIALEMANSPSVSQRAADAAFMRQSREAASSLERPDSDSSDILTSKERRQKVTKALFKAGAILGIAGGAWVGGTYLLGEALDTRNEYNQQVNDDAVNKQLETEQRMIQDGINVIDEPLEPPVIPSNK